MYKKWRELINEECKMYQNSPTKHSLRKEKKERNICKIRDRGKYCRGRCRGRAWRAWHLGRKRSCTSGTDWGRRCNKLPLLFRFLFHFLLSSSSLALALALPRFRRVGFRGFEWNILCKFGSFIIICKFVILPLFYYYYYY